MPTFRACAALEASSKAEAGGRKRASIGHKGLGFKSVLEITDEPQVFSATHELKSSGVDARVQTMSWNEWKTARGGHLREQFWLHLVGNLRADLDAAPFVRAIHDPFGTLEGEEVASERRTRAVQLRVREFKSAEHLDLQLMAVEA